MEAKTIKLKSFYFVERKGTEFFVRPDKGEFPTLEKAFSAMFRPVQGTHGLTVMEAKEGYEALFPVSGRRIINNPHIYQLPEGVKPYERTKPTSRRSRRKTVRRNS